MAELVAESERVTSPPEATARPRLIAYRTHPTAAMVLEPAPSKRPWMDATPQRFAYRCLPMLIANESGWVLRSAHTLLATWDGEAGKDGVVIDYLSGEPPYPAGSHFGHGIVTWSVPYLFRTSPGWNLLLRGAANWPKDGAIPLEGVIESDWSVATATMNWKLTRPGLTVRFDIGDPVCMLVPQRRGDLEQIVPEMADLRTDPELECDHQAWVDSRHRFLHQLAAGDADAGRRGWEKHYFQGVSPGGAVAGEHQRKLRLRPFATPSP